MRDFVLSREFVTGMTLHAYSEINLLPYGWARVRPENAAAYEEIARDLEQLTGYPHGQPWELLYLSNGRTQDWMAHDARIMVIEPEIGSREDGFWPPAERVPVLAEQNLPALLHMVRIAGGHPQPVGLEVRDSVRSSNDHDPNGFADPGETVELILAVRNKGWAQLDDLEVTVTARSSDLTIQNGVQRIGTLPSRSTSRLEALPILATISPDAAAGVPLALDLSFAARQGALPAATIDLVPGTPMRLFADDAEGGPASWVTTQGWGITRLSRRAAAENREHAFTDSPRRPYRANADNALVLAHPLDLSAVQRAELRYRERFATEPWDDLCYVEAATPGRGWEPLAIIPGGVETDFRERSLSLDAFVGEEAVSLRFRLTSNHSRQHEGWTIDDIEVWAYGRADSTAGMAAQNLPAAGVVPAESVPSHTRQPPAE
jgi:hypothetical protein